MSELRLYCDTLMQSVAAVKLSTKADDTPDIEVRKVRERQKYTGLKVTHATHSNRPIQ